MSRLSPTLRRAAADAFATVVKCSVPDRDGKTQPSRWPGMGSQNHWLGVNLVGKKSNRDAIGARISYQAAELKRSRMKVGGGSYLSYHDPRIVLGIGPRTKIDWLEVKWPLPGGTVQRFTGLPIDRYITL